MFKHYFEGIEGISVYPIISLIIFLSFFIGITLLAFLTTKKHCTRMADLPVGDDASISELQNLNSHEGNH